MLRAVITAEGLGKRYRRNAVVDEGLRHVLSRTLKAPLAIFKRNRLEQFWALKDVSLEVREGEVLGLVGRNGAGKTTLLKSLSRITQPTTGWAEIHGRVGSLLEVGTGFHPELSGRENTFLSGAILGMSKREIVSKFDEIVAFAELEKFIDTPVKHYSSGMYVRLAFAVAAHLEPKILLVDEVLAVGDLKFQKKCLGKMSDVARAGRTVVLVTHQMNQIRRLCHRALWIDGGTLRLAGPTNEAVSAYESAMSVVESRLSGGSSKGSTLPHFMKWEIVEGGSESPNILWRHGPVAFAMTLGVPRALKTALYGAALYDSSQQLVWAWATENFSIEKGTYRFVHRFEALPLRPGSYTWLLHFYDDGNLVETWSGIPALIIAGENFQSAQDEWNGYLNIQTVFEISRQ